MPRPANSRKRPAARRPVPVPVRNTAKKRAAVAKPTPSAQRAKGNGAVRTSRKAASAGFAGNQRRTSERLIHTGRPAPIEAPGASRGKYVYCIIESIDPLRFGPIGVGADPSDVYTVHYKNLAAVVSDAPLEVLDSTRENVLAH